MFAIIQILVVPLRRVSFVWATVTPWGGVATDSSEKRDTWLVCVQEVHNGESKCANGANGCLLHEEWKGEEPYGLMIV